MNDYEVTWGDIHIWSAEEIAKEIPDVHEWCTWYESINEGSYIPPFQSKNHLIEDKLCSFEEARKEHLQSHLPHRDVKFYKTRVRGTEYHYEALRNAPVGELWLELVREPGNPWDNNAIAVMSDNVRYGYVSRDIAFQISGLLDDAEYLGHKWVVPGFIEYFDAVWIVMPTVRELEMRIFEGIISETENLWKQLPQDFRDSIKDANYKLSEANIERFTSFHHFDKYLIPDVADINEFHWAWGTLFWRYRRAKKEQEIAKRNAQIIEYFEDGFSITAIANKVHSTANTVKKVLAENGIDITQRYPWKKKKEAKWAAKKSEIIRRYLLGQSKNSIACDMGVKDTMINKALVGVDTSRRKSPVLSKNRKNLSDKTKEKIRSEVFNTAEDRHKICIRAVKLQQEGFSRAELADIFNVSLDSIKDYLSDGKFYLSPQKYPERLELAKKADNEGWTIAFAKQQSSRYYRARRDATVLRKQNFWE